MADSISEMSTISAVSNAGHCTPVFENASQIFNLSIIVLLIVGIIILIIKYTLLRKPSVERRKFFKYLVDSFLLASFISGILYFVLIKICDNRVFDPYQFGYLVLAFFGTLWVLTQLRDRIFHEPFLVEIVNIEKLTKRKK